MVPQCCNPATGEQGQSGYTWLTGHIGNSLHFHVSWVKQSLQEMTVQFG